MFDTSRLSGTYTWCVFSLLGPLLSGCGSDSSNTNGNGSGQVTDEWRDFCVAKFTKDVAIRDFGDEVSFTAKTGEEYLLTTYGSFGSAPKVEIAYLTTAGPKTYEVPVTGGPETFPFTSSCTYDAAVSYYAAFTDVTVYDSESLQNVICTIPKGAALPRDMNGNTGYSAVTLSFGGPQTYSVMLNAFSTMCGGATEGFISVPETQVLNMTTWLIPIQVILKDQ